jgi:hypothetical protein
MKTLNVTFTKWMTSQPANPPSLAGASMAGIVGGAVGEGRFAGEVLSDDFSESGFWLAHTRYEFYGEKHSFTADVHVTETLATNKAVFTGIITQGWLKGAQVSGEWTEMAECPIATPATNVFAPSCIPGSLEIHGVPEQ